MQLLANDLELRLTATAENERTSKKGFLWGGSDGVDHVAREVLQHGVANRGSPTAIGRERMLKPPKGTTWKL